jgi:membrane fusion protein, multidrug efflux system
MTIHDDRRRGAGIAGVVVLALMATGCGSDARADAQSDEAAFQRVINVEVLPLEAREFQERIRIAGTVRANVDVTVSAEESGVVREVLVERGALVSEGQPIIRVDDRILQAQVEEAEARASLARETWDRRRRLFEDDNVGAELAYLEARYQSEQAEAVLRSLRERLDRSVIVAPVSGILEERDVEVGTMVSVGTPVARIVQIDPVKVVGGVAERYASDVSTSSTAWVTFDALAGERHEADVHYVGATVNPRNRTFEVELQLANPGRVIKPEMVAGIEILLRTREDVVVIPQEAVIRVEEGYVAFVVEEEDGRSSARVRRVRLGPARSNEVVVEEGLSFGDRVVVVGQSQVADGDFVDVVRTREVTGGGA